MNLAHLSLYDCTKDVPPPYSNDERARLLRYAMPSPRFNSHDWRTAGERYAAEQSPIDPIPCYADRRGF